VATRAAGSAAQPAVATQPVVLGESWHPTAGEVHVDVKSVAADVATRLTTYSASSTPDSIAASVTADPVRRPSLAAALPPLYHQGASSSGTVVYPQMGGFRTSSASVMVVVTQVVHGPAGDVRETRTLDIRLALTNGAWTFDQLASAGGVPVARPATLPSAATAVLDDRRITLTDSARWDIYRGAITPGLLTLMEALAARTPYAATVLETGHPHNVFATSHVSAHTLGHAMDVYRLGGVDVADSRAVTSSGHDQAVWVYGQPQLDQLGSPWVLRAGGHRSFTDTVHQDHLHIAVR
jgi:hypothetical protein